MIYRLMAYSLILMGIIGTIYMGVEGIYGDRYDVPSMSIESFGRQMLDSTEIILIDVRTSSEIEEDPAPWDITFEIPLLVLEERCVELAAYQDRIILLLCPTGNRSRQGARLLQQAGFDARYLENGMQSVLN